MQNSAVTKRRYAESAGKSMPRSENGSLNPNPKILSGAMPLARRSPKTSGWSKMTNSAMRANAIVASARYSPWSRSAGNAMSNPIGTATAAATSRPHGLPLLKRSTPKTCPPELENSMNDHAPTPTNVICASEICPDQPVSGTSESIGNAISITSVRLRIPIRSQIIAFIEHEAEQHEHARRRRVASTGRAG